MGKEKTSKMGVGKKTRRCGSEKLPRRTQFAGKRPYFQDGRAEKKNRTSLTFSPASWFGHNFAPNNPGGHTAFRRRFGFEPRIQRKPNFCLHGPMETKERGFFSPRQTSVYGTVTVGKCLQERGNPFRGRGPLQNLCPGQNLSEKAHHPPGGRSKPPFESSSGPSGGCCLAADRFPPPSARFLSYSPKLTRGLTFEKNSNRILGRLRPPAGQPGIAQPTVKPVRAFRPKSAEAGFHPPTTGGHPRVVPLSPLRFLAGWA